MEQRINGTGAKEPDVRTQGSNQIVIELPGVKDTAQALDHHRQDRRSSRSTTSRPARPGRTKGANGHVVPNPDAYKLLTGAGAKPITNAETCRPTRTNPSQEYVVVSAKKHKV